MTKWEYAICIKRGARLYHYDDKRSDVRRGLVWELVRHEPDPQGGEHLQTEAIMASPRVFEHEEHASRDALEKLSILRCPYDRPIDAAIKWLLG